jgi:hypothetical protein
MWALEELSVQEIFGLHHVAQSQRTTRFFDLASMCYFNLALCLWERGLRSASQHALRKALRSADDAGILTRVFAYVVASYSMIWRGRLAVWHLRHRAHDEN